MKPFQIAIDGPAGAGKSTIARKVAHQLGFIYIDTGAMYRAMALYLIGQGVKENPSSHKRDEQIALLCKDANISIVFQGGEQSVLLNGEHVDALLRTPEVTSMASICSAVPTVRTYLVSLQRKLAESQNVVMDGRDIGTVVLPHASLKIYLTASAKVRAKRRYLEIREKEGKKTGLSNEEELARIQNEIEERDKRDQTREISPLRQAKDAVLIDSSDMTVDQVSEKILNLAAEKLGRPYVVTASSAGFCFGVQNAVDTVYREIEKRKELLKEGENTKEYPINTFGPIIHNETVVEELEQQGVGILHSVDEALGQQGGSIILRSHGVSKATFDALQNGKAKVVDSTCPFVKKIHEIVYEASLAGKHVVIIGNHGHAETEGTVGWCVGEKTDQNEQPSNVTVIETQEEAEQFSCDKTKTVCIVAQTTFNAAKFEKFVAVIAANGYNIETNETICSATCERQIQAKQLAKKADVMIVIGGRGSSNTAKLYEICKEECGRTCFVQTADDLHLELDGSEKMIGITAGASTPKKIIEEVQSNVRRADF